ncbi:MAG TPA: ArsA family ATPase [Methylomirabilota bacterium]|nr:ArsA family ATPase [Methylomirabilota bacterium]
MTASRRRPPRRPAREPAAGGRLHFFAGKGGVGKTTCAAAAALAAAEAGARVAVISTDPAHSLGDALDRALGRAPRRVPAHRGRLEAIELDADRALRRWLTERRATLHTIAERGTYLDEEDLERLLRLSFPGVDELMALVELARLARRGRYELTVVDTAPTGHTLRLLGMPETLRRLATVLDGLYAKHRFLSESLGRGHRPGAPDRLIDELDRDGRELAARLRDPSRCRFSWLMLPEELSLEETRDGIAALAREGIEVGELVVNRVTPPRACAACAARRVAESRVLAAAREAFPRLPLRVLPALDDEPRGLPALRRIGRALVSKPRRSTRADLELDERDERTRGSSRPPVREESRALTRSATVGVSPSWLDLIAPPSVRLLVFAGKGGVGKTTCAAGAALALAAARPPARVLALSVDPAHSLGDALDTALDDEERAVPGAPAGLRAREVDADRAFARLRERYQRAVEETFESLLRGARFDVAYDREALRGLMDLAPPGLDELFAVLSVIEALFERTPPADVVVLDTAPTGHALRLLEMPATALEWVHALLAILLKYRDVVGLGEAAAEMVATARRLRELGALLGDGARARVVVVTRAAELPRRETERLLRRLDGLRLTVPAVVVNALTAPDCPRCRRARRREDAVVAALARAAGTRRQRWGMICTPAVTPPPRGAQALGRWTRTWERQ